MHAITIIVAQKALKLLNFSEFMGNELSVTWYIHGGIREMMKWNIFVKGLSSDTKSKDFYDFFSSYGTIFSCKVKYSPNGKCDGYGWVLFETSKSAENALSEANGKLLKNSKIEVSKFKTREERRQTYKPINNLYIKNIPKKFTNEELKSMFSGFGEITSAVVIKESTDAKENKGFGFVCFNKPEDAKNAEDKLNNTKLEGQTLFICQAKSKLEHKKQLKEERFRTYKDCNLYVKHLPEDVTDEKLKTAFDEFGKVVSARVMVNKTLDQDMKPIIISRKYGFVCFSNKEEAKKAIELASTKLIFNTNLYVAIAEKKEDRRAKYNQMMIPLPMPMYGMPPGFFPGAYPRRPRMPMVNKNKCKLRIG
jgi:polyadenylate-binding protein